MDVHVYQSVIEYVEIVNEINSKLESVKRDARVLSVPGSLQNYSKSKPHVLRSFFKSFLNSMTTSLGRLFQVLTIFSMINLFSGTQPDAASIRSCLQVCQIEEMSAFLFAPMMRKLQNKMRLPLGLFSRLNKLSDFSCSSSHSTAGQSLSLGQLAMLCLMHHRVQLDLLASRAHFISTRTPNPFLLGWRATHYACMPKLPFLPCSF